MEVALRTDWLRCAAAAIGGNGAQLILAADLGDDSLSVPSPQR
jgi:hypothetical protein